MRYILVLFILLFSSFSFTQDSDESADSGNIEEVVTSAFRKETALQDTGLAVTVLTATDIESKNLKEFYDFQYSVPGVLFQKTNFSGAGVQMRGMTNYAVGGSFSGIVTYREDEISMGTLQMAFNEMFDVDSFEVLRGPQGTLYGGNNPGGTFIVNSRDPGDEVDGYLRTEFGDLNTQRFDAAMTLNPGGKIRTRVSMRSTYRDGYVTNTFNGSDIDNRKYLGVRVKTIADISDDTSLTFTLKVNNESDARLRTQGAACNPNPIMGCEQWGELPTFGASASGVTAFGTIDYLTLNYPGDIVLPDMSISYSDGAVFHPEFDKASMRHNPRLEREDISSSINFESVLNDNWVMNFIASYNKQEYAHMQSLSSYVAEVPYRMGPVTANIFGLGDQTYYSDDAYDQSTGNYDENDYELRFSSTFGGNTEVVAGIYHALDTSLTNYEVTSPGFQYFAEVGKGPIGRMYPDLAGYGGLTFWGNYFGAYGLNLEDNIYDAVIAAAVGYVQTDPTTPAQIAALIPQLLAAGQCTNPATDCLQVAQMVLIGNAAELPQVVGAGYVNGVQASHDFAANAIRGAVAFGNTAMGLPYPVLPALPMWQQSFQSWNKSYRDSWGLFAEFNHAIDERTNLTFGGRFNVVTVADFVFDGAMDASGMLAGYNGSVFGFPTPEELSIELDEFTGRVILDRKYDDTLVYVKFDRGLKSGGFNPTGVALTSNAGGGAVAAVDPELHNVFELGTKGDYLGGVLRVNSSAYVNNITGMQLNKIIGLSSQTFNTDVQVAGVELEALLVPNEYTRISFVGAYNTSEIDGYSDYDPRNPYGITSTSGGVTVYPGATVAGMTDKGMLFRSFGASCLNYFNALLGPDCVDSGPVMQDLSGRSLPGVPEVSYSVGYETDLVNDERGLLTARLDYNYRGEYYATVFNNSHELVNGFSFTNFDMSYTSPSGKWALDFFIHNLEDKDVLTGAFVGSSGNGGGYNLYFQEPMNGGFSIIYNF